MKRLISAAALLLVALGASSCGDDDATLTGGGEPRPTTSGPALPEGTAILDPDDVGDYGPDDADWTPTAADVAAVDAVLAERLAASPADEGLQPLDAYRRQYVGVDGGEDGGAVAVNALCSDDVGGDLDDEWILVLDGGACFWQAVVRDGQVESLSVNGQA